MLFNDRVIDFTTYKDTLTLTNSYSPFDLAEMLTVSTSIIKNATLNDVESKLTALLTYIERCVKSNTLSSLDARLIERCFVDLLTETISLKEAHMTFQERYDYLMHYPVVIIHSLSASSSVVDIENTSLENALKKANHQLVSDVAFNSATLETFTETNHQMIANDFYLYDKSKDPTNRESYTYLGKRIEDVLHDITTIGYLNHQITPDGLTNQGLFTCTIELDHFSVDF